MIGGISDSSISGARLKRDQRRRSQARQGTRRQLHPPQWPPHVDATTIRSLPDIHRLIIGYCRTSASRNIEFSSCRWGIGHTAAELRARGIGRMRGMNGDGQHDVQQPARIPRGLLRPDLSRLQNLDVRQQVNRRHILNVCEPTRLGRPVYLELGFTATDLDE